MHVVCSRLSILAEGLWNCAVFTLLIREMLSLLSCSAVEAHLQGAMAFWLSSYWLTWGLGPILAAGKLKRLITHKQHIQLSLLIGIFLHV